MVVNWPMVPSLQAPQFLPNRSHYHTTLCFRSLPISTKMSSAIVAGSSSSCSAAFTRTSIRAPPSFHLRSPLFRHSLRKALFKGCRCRRPRRGCCIGSWLRMERPTALSARRGFKLGWLKLLELPRRLKLKLISPWVSLSVRNLAVVLSSLGAEVDVKRLPKRPAPPRFGRKLTEAQKAKATHICLDCGYIYTLSKPFDEQPDGYAWPQCRAPKKRFARYDVNTGRQ